MYQYVLDNNTDINYSMNFSTTVPVTVSNNDISTESFTDDTFKMSSFFISSNIELNCNDSLGIATKWTINNCTSECLCLHDTDPRIMTNLSEIFIPARSLSYGLYELNLRVKTNVSTNLRASESAFVRINPSGVTANLLQSAVLRVTQGYNQDLILGPGKYSVYHDYDRFEASVSR